MRNFNHPGFIQIIAIIVTILILAAVGGLYFYHKERSSSPSSKIAYLISRFIDLESTEGRFLKLDLSKQDRFYRPFYYIMNLNEGWDITVIDKVIENELEIKWFWIDPEGKTKIPKLRRSNCDETNKIETAQFLRNKSLKDQLIIDSLEKQDNCFVHLDPKTNQGLKQIILLEGIQENVDATSNRFIEINWISDKNHLPSEIISVVNEVASEEFQNRL